MIGNKHLRKGCTHTTFIKQIKETFVWGPRYLLLLCHIELNTSLWWTFCIYNDTSCNVQIMKKCTFIQLFILFTTQNNKIFIFRLQGVDSPDSQYRWRWFDTTSPGHFREEETNGTVTKINYTIVYPSSEVGVN